MTLKKQRQKQAIRFRKALGIDFALAKKMAKYNIDTKGISADIEHALTTVLGVPDFYKGCECCGNSRYVWKSKKSLVKLEYGTFTVV